MTVRAAALSACLLGASSAGAARPIQLKMATIAPEGSPYLVVCQDLAALMSRNCGGAVEIKVFPAGLLGSEPELMAQLAAGKIDLFCGTSIAAQSYIPELAVFDLPYLFEGHRDIDASLGSVWAGLEKAVDRRGYGLLGLSEVGFKHLGTRKPVSTVADLKALRFRSQPSALQAQMWELLGVPHRPIGQVETLEPLAGGSIEGVDSTIIWMFVSSWHLHVKHVTLTGHLFQPGLILLGPAGREKIPPRLLGGLSRGWRAVARRGVEATRKAERDLLDSLPGTGVQVHGMPGALGRDFRQLTRPLHAEWRSKASPAGRALLDQLARDRVTSSP